MAVGLLLGGVLVEYLSWRWGMFINLPIGVLAFVVALPVLVESRIAGRPRYDILGTAAVSAGLFALVFGFARAGTAGWDDPGNDRVADRLGDPAGSLRDHRGSCPGPADAVAAPQSHMVGGISLRPGGLCALTSFWLFVIYYLQGIQGYSALECGLAILPYSIGIVIFAAIFNQRLARLDPRKVIVFGLLWGAAGIAAIGRLEVGWPYTTTMLPVFGLIALGVILAFIAMSSASLDDAPEEDAGVASALFNAAQQVGVALGPDLLTTVAVERTDQVADGGPLTPEALTEGYGAAFTGAAVLLVAGAAIAGLLMRPRHSPRGVRPATVPPRASGFGGLVSAPGGAPAAGVALTLIDRSGRQVARTSTDPTGRYHLVVTDQGVFLMVVTGEGLDPLARPVRVGSESESHDVVLAGGGGVHGYVRSGNGPSRHALVVLIDGAGGVQAQTRTGADGHYEFSDVVPGEYTVSVVAEPAAPVVRSVTVTGSDRVHLDLSVPSLHRFDGVVHATGSGRPVPGAMVTLMGPGVVSGGVHRFRRGRVVRLRRRAGGLLHGHHRVPPEGSVRRCRYRGVRRIW